MAQLNFSNSLGKDREHLQNTSRLNN